MKLWTINTHSLLEQDYERKLQDFAAAVFEEKPDIIAMQEVNQLHISDDVKANGDNHVCRAVKLLEDKGVGYYWHWLPLKLGYSKYDEGLAIMSRTKITETDEFPISGVNDYTNWKTRKILGIKTDGLDDWFYTVHMGWWNDVEEPFCEQWERLKKHISVKERVWLMGDFNSRADVRNEGYDLVTNDGFYDTYLLAAKKDSGITARGSIDGWSESGLNKARIDYILCSEKINVKSSRVIFNNQNYRAISDHYGLEIIL